jgi:hypothetical protein
MGTKLGTAKIQDPGPPLKGEKRGPTGCMVPHTHHWLQETFLSTGVLWRCWRTLSNVLGPELRVYINVPLQCVPHL